MDKAHSGSIVFLLAAILCVMLFGANAVLTVLGWLAGIGTALAVVILIVVGVLRAVGVLRDGVAAERAQGRPWIWMLLIWPGFIGNFLVFGLAALRWMDGNIRYVDAVNTISYGWVPVSLMFGAMGVALIESAHEWGPKALRNSAAFFNGWLKLLAAPVIWPMRHWRFISTRQDQGLLIGDRIVVFATLLVTFAISLVVWFVAGVFPLAIAAALIIKSLR